MVQSLSSCSTALSRSCWRTLLFLLENKGLSENSHGFPAEVWKSKSLPWFDLRINPGLAIFCEKHSAQNLFCRSFKVIQQTGHALLNYRNLRFQAMCWFSIKMLPTIKTNPTAQSEKDAPETSEQPVHPGGTKREGSMPKSNLHQESVVTGGWRLSSSLIPGSPQCPNNPLDLRQRIHRSAPILLIDIFW